MENLGKGLVRQPEDPRDFRASFVFGASRPDWSREFRLREPGDENQGSSSSCVAQASSYYHWQHRSEDWSRRDLYCRIFLSPGGGAYLRDGMREIVDRGQATRKEVADPKPQTEANMESSAGTSDSFRLDGREANYWLAEDDIDSVALAVQSHSGAVFGVYGDNAGWADMTNPKPPKDADWAHALYAMGTHMHGGQKCVIAKSSWCGAQPGHHEHHIKSDYFSAGRVFNCWVLIKKENLPMVRRFKVNDHGKLGVMLITDGAFDAPIFWAKNEAMYDRLLSDYEVPADAPTISVP